ncbi:UNVERIFIED_CONTAM: hypothetical protein FKN15_026454 [Acipenser sinensis]
MGRLARGVEGWMMTMYNAQFPLLESLTFTNSHLGDVIGDAEGREEPADELETTVTVDPECEPEALETEDIDDEPPLNLSVEELANANRGEGSMGRGRQPIDIRLSVMAVTRRGCPSETKGKGVQKR